MQSECLVCGEAVDVEGDVEQGELVDCDGCGVELELLSQDPVTFAVFEEEEK
jgi:alpha-aminoadipate/glutamate carrier protein LysW